MIVRKVEASELLEAYRISALSFHWSLDLQGKTPEEFARGVRENPHSKFDSPATSIFAAFQEDGEMMSGMGVLPYRVYFDGREVPMAGIGSVCTYPQHRRKGAVRAVFEKALGGLYEKKVPFSYLYPFSEQFYAKFGYCRSSQSTRWDFDLRAIPDASIPGVFSLHRPGEEIGGFQAAYQAFAPKLNMMVARDEMDWDAVKNADPFKGESHAFLYRDQMGTPAGYFVFEKETGDRGRRIMSCKEMAFDGFPTLKAIMAFCKTFSADYDGVSFKMPSSLNLDHFCVDYPQSGTTRRLLTNGMARAVHVAEVLKSAAYKGSGSLALFVHDGFLPANNGLYRIVFENGEAKQVDFSPQPLIPFGTAKEQGADAEMSVNVFSAAILGNCGIEDFAYMDGVKLYADPGAADRVFYKKPCWINNYF